MPSLVYRRFRGDCIETYKYLHGKYDITDVQLFDSRRSDGPVTRGHAMKLEKQHRTTGIGSTCLRYRIVKAWNDLPEEIVMSRSVNEFKGRFDRHWGNRQHLLDANFYYGVLK